MDRGGFGGRPGFGYKGGRGGMGRGRGAVPAKGKGPGKPEGWGLGSGGYKKWAEQPGSEERLPSEVQIFIQGLPKNMGEKDVTAFIENKGFPDKIKLDRESQRARVHIYRDKETKMSKGEATVTFKDSEDQKKAILTLNGIVYQQGNACYQLTVTPAIVKSHQAKPPPPKQPGQGGGGGRGNARGRGRGGAGGGGGPMKRGGQQDGNNKGQQHGNKKARLEPYPGIKGAAVGQRGGHVRGGGHAGRPQAGSHPPAGGGYQGGPPVQPNMPHPPHQPLMGHPHGPPPRHPYHAGPPGPYFGPGPMGPMGHMGPHHGPPMPHHGHRPPMPPHGPHMHPYAQRMPPQGQHFNMPPRMY